MRGKQQKPQKKSWIILLLTFFGAKALIKKMGLDK